jgi:hypothetical protein
LDFLPFTEDGLSALNKGASSFAERGGVSVSARSDGKERRKGRTWSRTVFRSVKEGLTTCP